MTIVLTAWPLNVPCSLIRVPSFAVRLSWIPHTVLPRTYPVVDTDVDLALAGVDLGSREGAKLDPDKQCRVKTCQNRK
jgi:hypothetical protein